MGGAGAVPLRPLTVGELLDAALGLLRANARTLLLPAALLAVLESAALYHLRVSTLGGVPEYWRVPFAHFGRYWLLVSVGFGTETAILALLGARAARSALPGVPGGGTRVADPLLAAVTGAVGFVAALIGFIGWILWYAVTGLAAPVLAMDRRAEGPGAGPPSAGPPSAGRPTVGGTPPHHGAPARSRSRAGRIGPATAPFVPPPRPVALHPLGPFAAVLRSMSLVARGRFRPGGIRLLGYLAWFTIRLALGFAGGRALALLLPDSAALWAVLAGWVAVNIVAYPALACLDVVLHLENRMRVEGLDITLSRAARRGGTDPTALAVPR